MYSSLNKNAMEKLNDAFKKHGHKPTDEQLTALHAIQKTLTLMLSGNAEQKYYLSSLDPGMGKTTAILSWLDAYLEAPERYGNHGVLIALDRLEEIQRWIIDGSIPESKFAVRVSDATEEGIDLNNMGLGVHGRHEALVLYTTKKQIRNRSRVNSFDEIECFHFNNHPRTIRIWDESFSIGEEVILNPCDFGTLLTQLDSISSELTESVLQILKDIRLFKASGTYFMPKLPDLPDSFEHGTAWDAIKEKNVAGHLWRMTGQPISIHSEAKQQFIVDSSPKLPDDFSPCLILDASARLKAQYAIQEEARKDIIHLPYSNKSYRELDVSVWERKSGKQIINDMETVVAELAALITEYQGEEFLVILHKGHRVVFKKALSKELSREQFTKVKFCTWMRHTATNEFSDISNIIMLSPFQTPDYVYEATTRAATAMCTAKGKPSQEYISRVKKGEICSNILQAVNRGKVRKSQEDTCPPCRLWLITHPNTGIAKELPNIFPECKIQPWKVKAVHLPSSKQRKTFAHIQALIKLGIHEVLATTVREHLGFKGSASNFTRDVINQSAFEDALESIGWKCVMIGINYVFRSYQVIPAS